MRSLGHAQVVSSSLKDLHHPLGIPILSVTSINDVGHEQEGSDDGYAPEEA